MKLSDLKSYTVLSNPSTSLVAPVPDNQSKTGYLGRLKESFGERKEEVKDIRSSTASLPEKILQEAGQVAGGVLDIVAEAPVIKQGLETFGKGVQKLSETKPIQKIAELTAPATQKALDTWNSLPKNIQKDLEAVMNISALIPTGGALKVVGRESAPVIGKGLVKTGTAIESGATKAAVAKKDAFIRDLIRPEQTKAVKEAQVGRTTEVGKGIFKRSEIEPTAQELASEEAVKSITGISAKNTNQQNFNIIKEANKGEAESLISQLKQVETQVGKDRGFFTPNEFKGYMDSVKKELADNPLLVGDAEKTAGKILDKFSALVKEEGHTPTGLLSARKKLDAWMESQKGANIFDPKTDSAISIALRSTRQGANDFLASKVPDVAVKESLARQSALYRAMDNIKPKAAIEANTAVGRAFQNMAKAVGIKNKLVQQVAAIVGVGGLGAAATFAPTAAVVGGLGFLVYKGGKLILKPELRVTLGKLLKTAGNAISKEDSLLIKSLLQDNPK